MQVDRVRRAQVQRVGAAATHGGDRNDHRARLGGRIREKPLYRPARHEREVAREHQHGIRAPRDCVADAPPGRRVLALLARLHDVLGAELLGERANLVAAGHDQQVRACRRGADGAPCVPSCQRSALAHVKGRPKSLLG